MQKSSLIPLLESWGEIEEVAQVSIMSVSASTSSFEYPAGKSFCGSIGSWLKSAIKIFPSSPLRLEYQIGNGTPKYLWREMHQSQARLSIHCSTRIFINSGYQLHSLALAFNCSFLSRILTNHCGAVRISIGAPDRSAHFTAWVIGVDLINKDLPPTGSLTLSDSPSRGEWLNRARSKSPSPWGRVKFFVEKFWEGFLRVSIIDSLASLSFLPTINE